MDPALSTERSDRDRLEALRRRIYGPHASAADRQEYAALLDRSAAEEWSAAEAEPAVAATPPEPEAPPPVRHRRPAALVVIPAVAAALVIGLAAVATTVARHDARPPVATRSAVAVWSGTAEPTPAPLPTPATLAMQRSVIAAQRTSGGGSAIIPLRLESAPRHGGTLVVAISSSDPAPVGWVAQRHREGSHDAGAVEQVAADPPALRQGAAAPTVVGYAGAPPSQIVVRAPAGTGWTITVAFTG